MIYTVELTSSAEADLHETVDYISRVLDNSSAAETFLNQLDHRITELSTYPEAYPIASDTHLRELGMRVFSVGNYLGIYRVRHEERKVVILRLLYGRRDWISLLTADAP